jgi:hypothetical protein
MPSPRPSGHLAALVRANTCYRRNFLTEYRFDSNQFSTMHRARIKKKWENAHATCKRRRDFSEPTIIVGMGEIDPQATLDRTGGPSSTD